MKFRRVKIKAIISILIILILIGSSMIMNVSGPNSIESKTEIEENQGVLSTSRSASINVKNFTDFSNGHLVENTRIDTNGHMGLTWEPPKNPYETDENTLLLSHFDNMYEGNKC